MLQDTCSVKTHWRNEGAVTFYFHTPIRRLGGVLIAFKKSLAYKIHRKTATSDGHSIICDMEVQGTRFTLTNLYAPNNDDQSFLQKVFEHVESMDNECQIYGGDFNIILDPYMDLKKTHSTSPSYNHNVSKFLQEYMLENDLMDIWRVRI